MSEKELEKKVASAELKEEETEKVAGGIFFTQDMPQGDNGEGLVANILRAGLASDDNEPIGLAKDSLLGDGQKDGLLP